MPLPGRSQTVGRLDMPKILTVDPDGAFVRLYEPYGGAQNLIFAGSPGPDTRDFLARRHVEIDVVEDHVIAIALCDASHREQRLRGRTRRRRHRIVGPRLNLRRHASPPRSGRSE